MPHINIKKGHDIRISGKPDKNIASLNNPKTLATAMAMQGAKQ